MPQNPESACSTKYKVHQLGLFSSLFFEFSVQIPVQPASIDSMFLVFFFHYFALFFVWQTWRTASLPFDATSSHAFACYCVEQRKDFSSQTIHCFYRDVLLNCTCMLDMYGFFFFFFFLCLKMSCFLSDSSMAFILHLWPPHFFGTATKKWQDFPTHPPPSTL